MAKTVIVCPSCGKKLETDRDNIGREGQCPACEKVFTVPEAQAGGGSVPGRWRGDLPPEYENLWVLSGVALMGIALLLLIGSTFLLWINPNSPAADYMAWQKTLILVISVSCLGSLLFSALTRKSFAPTVLLAAAWGPAAGVCMAGMLRHMETIVETARERGFDATAQIRVGLTFTPHSGLYMAAIAGVLLVVAAVYAWYQYRSIKTVKWFLPFLLVSIVLGFFVGLYVLNNHLKPSLSELSGVMGTQQEAALHRSPPGGPFT
jgi:hypothetical protein